MSWLVSAPIQLSEVAGKATLMYLLALLLLRVGERRTLAQWTVIDVVAAVALGAIIGRTAVARTESVAVGAVALVTVLVLHQLASRARFYPPARRLLEHRVKVLVAHGQVQGGSLRRAGLTEADLFAALRQRGMFSLYDLRYVLYEANGALSIVPENGDHDYALVTEALSATRQR